MPYTNIAHEARSHQRLMSSLCPTCQLPACHRRRRRRLLRHHEADWKQLWLHEVSWPELAAAVCQQPPARENIPRWAFERGAKEERRGRETDSVTPQSSLIRQSRHSPWTSYLRLIAAEHSSASSHRRLHLISRFRLFHSTATPAPDTPFSTQHLATRTDSTPSSNQFFTMVSN